MWEVECIRCGKPMNSAEKQQKSAPISFAVWRGSLSIIKSKLIYAPTAWRSLRRGMKMAPLLKSV